MRVLLNKLLLFVFILSASSLYAQDVPDTNSVLFREADKRVKKNQATSKDFYDRGAIYSSIGKNAAALQDYSSCIKLENGARSDLAFAAFTNRGSVYQRIKNYDEALSDFNEAISLQPDHAIARNNRGYLYQVIGQFEPAIEDFNRAIKLDKKYSTPYVNLSDVYAALNQEDDVIRVLNLLIQNIPENPRSYIQRADYYQAKGQMNAALRDWNKAVEASNDDPDYLIERSKFKDDIIFDDKGAIEDCENAIAINPNVAGYYYALARPYYDLNDYGAVLENCEKAIELDPSMTEAIIMRANIMDMYGAPLEARVEYRKAIKIDPVDYDGYRQLAVSYVGQSMYDSALIVMDEYFAKNEDRFNMREQRAKILVAKGDLDASITEFKKLIELQPENPLGYYFVGYMSDSIGNKKQACEYMKKANDLGMNDAFDYLRFNCPGVLDKNLVNQAMLFDQAIAFEKNREFKKAISVYDELIKIDPDKAAYYYNRGKQKRFLEDHAGAIADYKESLIRDSSQVVVWISIAVSKQLTRDLDGAIEVYKHAMKVDPTDAMIYYNLGNIYASVGDYKKGIEYLKQALEYNVNYANAYMSLGECYVLTDQAELACHAFRKAEELGVSQAFAKRVKYCN